MSQNTQGGRKLANMLFILLMGMLATVTPAAAIAINTTDIDQAFTVLTVHVMPGIGDVIGATPGIIIPLVILIVIIMVLFFFPMMLGALLTSIETAIKGKI